MYTPLPPPPPPPPPPTIISLLLSLSISLLSYRNSKLKEQLQTLKKKEAEETKALEDMVAKVEENLVTTTVSAVPPHTVLPAATSVLIPVHSQVVIE